MDMKDRCVELLRERAQASGLTNVQGVEALVGDAVFEDLPGGRFDVALVSVTVRLALPAQQAMTGMSSTRARMTAKPRGWCPAAPTEGPQKGRGCGRARATTAITPQSTPVTIGYHVRNVGWPASRPCTRADRRRTTRFGAPSMSGPASSCRRAARAS